MIDKKRWNEIQAIVLFAIALLIFISFVTFDFSDVSIFTSKVNHPVRNFAGLFGAIFGAIMFFTMGMSAYVIPLLMLSWALARFSGVEPQKIYFKIFGTFFLILASSALFSICGGADNSVRFSLGGLVGLVFSDFLLKYLGFAGSMLVIIVLFLLSVLLATEFLLIPFLSTVFNRSKEVAATINDRSAKIPALPTVRVFRPQEGAKEKRDIRTIPGVNVPVNVTRADPVAQKRDEKTVSPARPQAPVKEEPQTAEEKNVTLAVPQLFNMPSLDLLDSPPPLEDRKIKDDFDANSKILEETLADFDIEAKVVAFNKGPVITRYELEPAPGVKIHRITSLSDNIALAMKAQSVRIVAPIPGKGTIGVEVPNSSSTLVYLKEVLDSKEYKD